MDSVSLNNFRDYLNYVNLKTYEIFSTGCKGLRVLKFWGNIPQNEVERYYIIFTNKFVLQAIAEMNVCTTLI